MIEINDPNRFNKITIKIVWYYIKIGVWTKRKKEAISKWDAQKVFHQKEEYFEYWYIIPEVWKAQELIYEAHIKYESFLQIDPKYKYWRQDIDDIICFTTLEISTDKIWSIGK